MPALLAACTSEAKESAEVDPSTVVMAAPLRSVSRGCRQHCAYRFGDEPASRRLAEGVEYELWTMGGGTVPGIMLRVRQEDTVELRLKNGTNLVYSIDLHAVTGPGWRWHPSGKCRPRQGG
jgi:hypothetical protein